MTDFENLKEKLQDIEIAMFTTIAENGRIHSRPMSTHEMDESGNLWFFTNEFSGKIDEVTSHKEVHVSYSNPEKQKFVSVTGTAEIINDPVKKKEIWKPVLKAWFPKGVEDPSLTLLKIHVLEAEYWDSSSSKMVQLFEMAKALVSGKQYEEGEHGKFDINNL